MGSGNGRISSTLEQHFQGRRVAEPLACCRGPSISEVLYLVTFREFLVNFLVKVFPLAPGDLEELTVYFSQAGYGGAHFELP